MDNSIHFWKYNSGGMAAHQWQDTPFFLKLHAERRQRSDRIGHEKSRNLARRELQRTILQLLIDAQREPVHVDAIARRIGRSRQATTRFLFNHPDDLWIGVNGGRTWWVTSLQLLPDRLFY